MSHLMADGKSECGRPDGHGYGHASAEVIQYRLDQTRRWRKANPDRLNAQRRRLYERLSGYEYNRMLLRHRRGRALARLRQRAARANEGAT